MSGILHDAAPRAGHRQARRVARAFAATVAVLGSLALAGAGVQGATWLYAGVFVPDHAAPGATVRVTEFPVTPDQCPQLEVYLALEEGITSASDDALTRLHGRVENVVGGNQGGLGTHLQPNLVFAVPALPAGQYHGYWRCPTGAEPNPELAAGGDFRVDPATPSTSTFEPAPGTPAPPIGPLLLLLAVGTGLVAWLARLAWARARRGSAGSAPGGDE
jgi:hypothetical protein